MENLKISTLHLVKKNLKGLDEFLDHLNHQEEINNLNNRGQQPKQQRDQPPKQGDGSNNKKSCNKKKN